MRTHFPRVHIEWTGRADKCVAHEWYWLRLAVFLVIFSFLLTGLVDPVWAQGFKCPPGFNKWGNDFCMQANCGTIKNAFINGVGECRCKTGRECREDDYRDNFDPNQCKPQCPPKILITCVDSTELCPCEKSCAEYHGTDKIHGPEATGKVQNGVCNCSCKSGYIPDETLTCIRPTQEACDQSCRDHHGPNAYGEVKNGECSCRCQDGSKPEETGTTCSDIPAAKPPAPPPAPKPPAMDCPTFCKQQAGGAHATGTGTYPDCWCDCEQGYDASEILGGQCERSCDLDCKQQYGPAAIGFGDPVLCESCGCMYPWKMDNATKQCVYNERNHEDYKDLELFLRSIGYDESACPPTGPLPPGSVRFWTEGITTTVVSHSSVTLPPDDQNLVGKFDRQLEMGHSKEWGDYAKDYEGLKSKEDFQSAILPNGMLPKTTHNYNFTPFKQLPALCPPPLPISFDLACMQRLEGIKREYGKPTQWNCHGFSAHAIKECVKTGVQVKPGTAFDWKITPQGAILVVSKEGGIHSTKPITIELGGKIRQFQSLSEYTIDFKSDQSAVVRVIEGKVVYQSGQYSASLASGQLVAIDPTGVPSAPTSFDINAMERWWDTPASPSSSLRSGIAILSSLAIGGALLLILAGAAVAVVAVTTSRARPPAQLPRAVPSQVPPVSPTRLDIAYGSANVASLNLSRQGVTIGRDLSNTLTLHDASVSRQHARLTFENGTWVIYDLNSRNGTFVNGTRITRQPLRDGDQIQIGQAAIVFRG